MLRLWQVALDRVGRLQRAVFPGRAHKQQEVQRHGPAPATILRKLQTMMMTMTAEQDGDVLPGPLLDHQPGQQAAGRGVMVMMIARTGSQNDKSCHTATMQAPEMEVLPLLVQVVPCPLSDEQCSLHTVFLPLSLSSSSSRQVLSPFVLPHSLVLCGSTQSSKSSLIWSTLLHSVWACTLRCKWKCWTTTTPSLA